MQIDVLGPLEVRDAAGRTVPVAGARLRTLLTRLALAPGRPVSVSVLVDAVWGGDPPADEANALQTLVSRLRRALGGPDTVSQSQAGYQLAVQPDAVDAVRFERLAADGGQALRAGNPREAAHVLATALGLWRGPALADAVGDALTPFADRLEDLRLLAAVDRIDADLAIGDPAMLVPELEALVAAHPLHERGAGQLMRALGASGRQADALAAYERLRTRLADELGVDPGPEAQQLHLDLLRGELATRPQPPRRTNLKAQLTSFVGRENEVARITKSLEQNRLVTLVGPGGAGKTRLAAEAAAEVGDSAPDGIWLVELAQVTTGADVPQAVLGSLGLREAHLLEGRNKMSARDAITRLLEALAGTQTLLVLDNCEHVIDASARLVDQLLAECPDLRVLATSREPLGIFGELLLSVPPLHQPAVAAGAAEALEYPAIRLFADRAATVRPDFDVTDETVATVIEIVHRLDGLPLAIELAAARLRSLPVDEIARRLTDRFRLLTGGSRTALPRHRTLRAVVEWSWDLLTDDERRLAEQLSVFPSGVTSQTATAVSDVDPADVPDLLASLIDKSLLQPLDGGRRARMLETIREFGMERLGERGELGAVRQRHADHFAGVLARAEPFLTTADQLPWFELVGDERDNMVAAMRYRCDVGDADGALTMAIALGSYAMMLGNHAEIAVWVGDALAVPGGSDEQLRLIARAIAAMHTATSDTATDEDVETGKAYLRELAHGLVAVDPDRSRFVAILRAAVAYFAEERELTERFIAETVESGDPWSRAGLRMFRAAIAENEGDVEGMRTNTSVALSEFRQIGERWGLANGLRLQAQLLMLDGNLNEAHATYQEALALADELKSRDDECLLLGRLADIEIRRGDLGRAREYMERAKRAATDSGALWESVYTLAMLGGIEQRAGNHDEARRLQHEAMARVAVMPAGHPALGHLRAILLAIAARLGFEDGDAAEASRLAAESFAAAVGTRDMPVIASVGVTLADIAARAGDATGAALMLGAAARVRGADDVTAPEVADLSGQLRTVLGADRFAELYARGKALDRATAIERLDPAGSFDPDGPRSTTWLGSA